MNTIIKNSKDLGLLIRSRRKQLKVTQRDLALSCGTGLRFIIDLEKGKPTCQTEKAIKVLNSLGVQLNIFLPDAENDI